MLEIVLIPLAIVVMIAVGGVLFCLWLGYHICRGIVKLFLPSKPVARRGTDLQSCPNADCRSDNPGHARFCRRCGRPLPAFMRLVDARAA